ncbi:hypothetical protein EB796_006598 [Bugula neritina]|uniref:Uncharacterized protein n=1 Tax=Bugula neritina TaxID=10212 RepID=A0A7J7K8X6_BUGNE|nr:hypothetical protein EB796_011602 [Bugula neritina]KAF6035092.1 hypothetical protein EB796_006598 [Bugula neritina]
MFESQRLDRNSTAQESHYSGKRISGVRNLVPDVRITQIRQEFRNARKLLQWKNDFWCSVTVLERDRDTAMVRRFISQQL